ncbi:MAG: hypothetical protein P8O70_21840 [SAR324 cluster bacterium]|jgi:hypothetical protein|nr:hypothetical protein [SAR324 cluster bacterium]
MATKKKHVPKFKTFTAFLSNFRETLQEKVRLKHDAAGQQSVS